MYQNAYPSNRQTLIRKPTTVIRTLGLERVSGDSEFSFSLSFFRSFFLSFFEAKQPDYCFYTYFFQGCSYQVKYLGSRSGTSPQSKVYDFQVVNKISKAGAQGNIKHATKKDAKEPAQIDFPAAPAWAEEASHRPMVPARVPDGMPTYWSLEAMNQSHVTTEQSGIFMAQIGVPLDARGLEML
jgi:hypothetical protein